MNKRHPEQGEVIRRQLEMLHADDEFLSALAQGVDPSNGGDELAELLLVAREEVISDVPKAPTLAELGFVDSALGTAATGELPVVHTPSRRTRAGGRFAADAVDTEADELHARFDQEQQRGADNVVALRPRRSRAFMHGLVGAAAATLIIAGSGAVVHNAEPGSALYPLHEQIFGGHDVEVVQLASTLQEANKLKARGDIEGAKQKLAEAQALVERMKPKVREEGRSLVDKASADIAAPESSSTTESASKTTEEALPEAPTTEEAPVETPSATTSPAPEASDTQAPEVTAEEPTAEATAPRALPPVEETSEAEPDPKEPVLPQSLHDMVKVSPRL